MSDSFQMASGRKVVSRATAQQLGSLSRLVVDARLHRVVAVVIGKGKKAQLIDWDQLSGFGPDAVMVTDEAALRAPGDSREQAAADGRIDLVGKRLLTENGTEMGVVDDVTFDPATGVLEVLRVGDVEVPAETLLAAGSYAVVVDGSLEPAS